MTTRHKVTIIDVVVTALDPIHQGGDKTGTTLAELRREEMVVAGVVERVPIVSANSIAHGLREAAVFWMMDQIGLDMFQADQVRAVKLLFSGGGRATKVGSATYIDLYEEHQLRSLFPTISLFGGTMGNRMLKGRLRVGNAVPVCKETIARLPEWLREQATLSMYDLIQELSFSSMDPRENADYDHVLEPEMVRQYRAEQEERRKENKGGSDMKLRQTTECLKAGTLLFFDLTLFYPTAVELGTFLGGLSYFYERPFLGGKRNRGFGRVSLEFRQFEVQGLARVECEADAGLVGVAAEHLAENAETIKQMVNAL